MPLQITWSRYDAVTSGNVITSTTALSPNTTYYVALIDPVTGCESSLRLEVSPRLNKLRYINGSGWFFT
ncbi:hypothetical protein N7U66_10130 [Lacinutrix neustonica]|uniref:Uncharacterized protein n=1 Tax=Lacinutrix neustonica TaxID=2980107 RepID=A0A9E8MZI1_9FLAO|nr:hypothetical protein [Lacinutrix neustonica]WAC03744.1 hypothetical protein N7U66_10130 [Lacinutrix neustonica]